MAILPQPALSIVEEARREAATAPAQARAALPEVEKIVTPGAIQKPPAKRPKKLHDFDRATGRLSISTGDAVTNTVIWQAWHNDWLYAAYTSTTAATIDTEIWTAWNAVYFNSSITTGTTTNATYTLTDRTWGAWNTNHEEFVELREANADAYLRYSRRNLTEEELKRELEREKRYREEAEKRAKAAEEAKQRAERLLLANLTPKQREDLKTKNCFYIEIPLGDGKVERYRIDRGTHGNVKQIDDRGSIIRSFCIQPDGVPAADAMLAQKLFIEADEETRAKFWETANISDLMPAKMIPYNIPRNQRRQYALQHGLLH